MGKRSGLNLHRSNELITFLVKVLRPEYELMSLIILICSFQSSQLGGSETIDLRSMKGRMRV